MVNMQRKLHRIPEHRVLDGHNLEEREERYNTRGYVEEKLKWNHLTQVKTNRNNNI